MRRGPPRCLPQPAATASAMDPTAVCIITVNRRIPTLSNTVGWMRSRDKAFAKAKLAVSVGSPDMAHTRMLPPVDVLPTSQAEWESWGGDRIHKGYHLTRNMLRALHWLELTGAKVCIFAEDDVEVTQNWLTRIHRIVQAIPDKDFAITCCSSHPGWCFGPHRPTAGLDQYAQFNNPEWFWGNQLLVYPHHTLLKMTRHVEQCVASWKHPDSTIPKGEDWLRFGDQATKAFFMRTKIPLYVTLPSLARHTGEYNTWGGQGRSHAFRDHPTARFSPEDPACIFSSARSIAQARTSSGR